MTTATLIRLSIGLIGTEPGQLFLSTNATNAQVQVPGFLNSIAKTSNANPANGDFVLCSASDGSEYYTLSKAVNGDFTLNPAGGSAGGFDYVNTFWVASNGSDTNAGRNQDAPFLTLQHALSLCINPAIHYVINVVGSDTLTGPFTKPLNANVLINARGTIFSQASNNMFNGAGGAWQVLAGAISAAGFNVFNVSATTFFLDATVFFGNITNTVDNSTILFVEVDSQIAGNIVNASNGRSTIRATLLTGDITDTSPAGSTPRLGIFFDNVTGNISSTNNAIYGYVPSVTGTVSGISQGWFNGISYGPNAFASSINLQNNTLFNYGLNTLQIAGAVLLDETMSGVNFVLTNPAATTITLPNHTTNPNIPYNFFIDLTQEVQASGAQIIKQGSDVLIGQGQYTGAGTQRIVLADPATAGNGFVRTWTFGGNVFGSNFAVYPGPNFYVSQLYGNDSTGDGTLIKQFATPSAALAYIVANFTAHPANPVNIFITDDQTYTDQLDFTGTSKINFIGREANFTYASSGPGDDGITTNSPAQFIALAVLGCTGGGKSLNNTGTGTIECNIDNILTNGEIDNTSTGRIVIQSTFIRPAMPNTGGGSIFYSTIQRTGIDGVGVTGNSAIGTSSTWTAASTITATTGDITATIGRLIAGTTVNGGTGVVAQTGGLTAVLGNVTSSDNAGDFVAGGRYTDSQGGFGIARIDSTLLTFTNLAGGAHQGIIFPAGVTNQFVITDIKLNGVGGTNFSGAGGDRDLIITDGSSVWTTIPATTLQGLVNNDWGSVDVPFSLTVPLNQLSAAGNNIYAVYANGSADYTAGSVEISLEYARVV